ncbi:PREDICTED: mediator of RNA polymerase II transcription subunit 15 isoform X2 [Ceratosolen solmsi marchali]|uniref:Mediator of RNA polymerase II transcription subunit 15 n=1 Tax=Ceratosolen solmsi marchali TaxID=326594 RepID=A0AAJ6YG32_9HYME|nr:PREDICTED: mediator of RNA polymerase II transcription subunit 15 isoform X2 [Ceratosolen solmsi marchali]
MSSEDPNSWRTPTFRQSMIAKIEENIQKFQIPIVKNASDMENHVFMKAKTKEDYLGFVARLILHISQMNNKKPAGTMAPGASNTNAGVQQGMPDPIGALQTLARQGTGNNANMGMPGGPGQSPQTMVSQQAPGTNTATNLLQSLNQRPGQPMNMPGMHNKMSGMSMMSGQPGCPPMAVNQMGQMQNMQGNPMLAQINQMNQASIGQQMGAQPGQPQQMGGAPMNVSQIGQNQMQAIQNQMQNQMGGHQLGGSINTGMQPVMTPQQGPQQQQHMNQINSAQIAANQLSQTQLSHLQRKPVEMMNAGFPGPRNVTPNQFLRQSPSPSAPSPGGLGAPTQTNQMVASPALVPSPNTQHTMLAGAQRSVAMAPSPSSSLNTPAGALGATPSPLQDDQTSQAYKDKVRKLSKYIEPLRKMILKMTNEGNTEKMSKMKKLLEILTNPSSSTKLDVLQKCEVVLEKMDFKKLEAVGPTVPTTLKEHHFFTPLLEVVNTLLQSPVANHTLHRTFGPCLEALFGPEIKNLPPPLKKQRTEETSCEIPDVLQGEIARLDQRFKISLDPAQQNGSKCIQLICWLDDKHLPCVPPVLVIVPTDYPTIPPRCVLTSHEYTTTYLSAVQKGLDARLAKLPKRFSVSQLLDTWEMSVRQASAPKAYNQHVGVSIAAMLTASTVTTATTTTTTGVSVPATTTASNVTNALVNDISTNSMITISGS